MHTSKRYPLPLIPLLHAYTSRMPGIGELGRLPGIGPRFAAIQGATARFLFNDFVDSASNADLSEALTRFYEACAEAPVHTASLQRKIGMVRHGLAHLLRGRDSLAKKSNSYLALSGAYHVPGLGPSLWCALFQAMDSSRNPGWNRVTRAGLYRLGLARTAPSAMPDAVYGDLQHAYAKIQALAPSLSALHVDHFLTRVAGMVGRDLWADNNLGDPVPSTVNRERHRLPPRNRITERGAALQAARLELEAALGRQDRDGLIAALANTAGTLPFPNARVDGAALVAWVRRLWESEDIEATLAEFWQADPIAEIGLWLAPAVLHLRDPNRFLPWSEELRRGHARLSDAADQGSMPQRYGLLNEAGIWLRQQYGLHPFEVPDVLSLLGRDDEAESAETTDTRNALSLVGRSATAEFRGFCADTFTFLDELTHNNQRDWMEAQRPRYRFAVREPMVELCRGLATRFVTPVLRGACGWDLDVEARSGHALTSICRNAFGRGGPYNTALWITFCRRGDGGQRTDAQLFFRVGVEGVRFGMRIGKAGRNALGRLRRNVDGHADLIFRLLRDNGSLAQCRFGPADLWEASSEIASANELATQIPARSFEASRFLAADSALLGSEELVGEVLLTMDRLLPLFACAMEEDAGPFLMRRSGAPDECFAEADFRRNTWLGDDWLKRARGLLQMKRQLILQGVPGTGKTHVARCLARLLTAGRAGAVRLVQFHPAYSYEEFVEGIKARSVDVGGRYEMTYPVEPGLLCQFAAEAEQRPSEPFVLLIDEINRGNLPRIFGELLYLLEYRGQSIDLPYSRRSFRLPANLYLIGTMNATDRSVAQIDRALRRRFSFLEMPPDASVLAAWFGAYTPASDANFADSVINLLTRLNTRLSADLGSQAQIGHSYFMVPGLDEAKLRIVWRHHVQPLLEEYFIGQSAQLANYDLDTLLEDLPRRRARASSAKSSDGLDPGLSDAFPNKPR
jgi:5-methylcytosine-specific restriction enzyme B